MLNKLKEFLNRKPADSKKTVESQPSKVPPPSLTFEEQLLLSIQYKQAKDAEEQEKKREEYLIFEQQRVQAKQTEKKIRLALEKLLIDNVEPLLKTIIKHHAPGAEITRRSHRTYDGKYVAEMSLLWDRWESTYQYSYKSISIKVIADNEHDTSPTTVIIGETGESFDLKYSQQKFERSLLSILEKNQHIRSGDFDLGGGP